MTFEEYKDKLLTRPLREHDALWKTYNYAQFQRLVLDLVHLREEARKYEPKDGRTNVLDFESYRKKLTNEGASTGSAGCCR